MCGRISDCEHKRKMQRPARAPEGTVPAHAEANLTGPAFDMKRRPATQETVRLFNGPGNNGSSVRNGVTYNLKAGDDLSDGTYRSRQGDTA
jgi:hypothetical protein